MWINSNNNARIDQIAGIRESTENVYPIENEIKINHKKNLCNVWLWRWGIHKLFEWYCSALTIAVAPQTLNKRYIIILWWRQLELHSEKCKHLFAASRFFSPSTAKWMQNRAHSFWFCPQTRNGVTILLSIIIIIIAFEVFFSLLFYVCYPNDIQQYMAIMCIDIWHLCDARRRRPFFFSLPTLHK